MYPTPFYAPTPNFALLLYKWDFCTLVVNWQYEQSHTCYWIVGSYCSLSCKHYDNFINFVNAG